MLGTKDVVTESEYVLGTADLRAVRCNATTRNLSFPHNSFRMVRFARLGILLLILVPVRVARAQDAIGPVGFFVGAGAEGDWLTTSTPVLRDKLRTTERGVGASLMVGYGSNAKWAVLSQVSRSRLQGYRGGSYVLTHVDLDVRYHFRWASQSVVPFVQAGPSVRAASDDTDTGRGFGLSFGTGINAFVRSSVAITAALVENVGTFDSFTVNDRPAVASSTKAFTTRLHLGLAWFYVD